MKRKLVLSSPPVIPKTPGDVTTWQQEGTIMILNRWAGETLEERYCINLDTGEHEVWNTLSGIWHVRGYLSRTVFWKKTTERIEDKGGLLAALKESALYHYSFYPDRLDAVLYEIEHNYNERRYEGKVERKESRLAKLQRSLPPEPEVEEFVYQLIGAPDYLFRDKETGVWSCTNCGKETTDGKWKHNEAVACPHCGKMVIAKRLTGKIEQREQCYVLQKVNTEYSIERCFDILYRWTPGKKSCGISENKTVIIHRKGSKQYARGDKCKVYYNTIRRDWSMAHQGMYRMGDTNPGNRRSGKGYLWPEGISQALQDTRYERWGTLFQKMSIGGMKVDYNRLLCLETKGAEKTLEMLWEGRFKRLIRETADSVRFWDGTSSTDLILDGDTMEEVFGLDDRQKINRIRQKDGGMAMLVWLRYAEKTGQKVSDEVLEWLGASGIRPGEMRKLFALTPVPMSLTQIVNYLKKQKAEEYKNLSPGSILDQWMDYLDMASVLGKDLSDEMVYRPRELKRRHDEYAEERRKNQDAYELKKNEGKRQEAAAKLREQFPNAETVLAEIRDRYEFEDEIYRIIVPRELLEIVTEGAALHHCAGSSNRYYERIENRETYICFLRRKEAPEQAFYTIEVEPGGTIRQHRGYCDEEPGIDEIRPFLREWQKEIRKRMSREDHELAAQSELLRRKNIEDLIAKGNVRVLKGLEEDFMEAVNE